MKRNTFAGQITGQSVEVLRLVPPVGDFHSAKPSPSAATSVVQSDLALPLGLGSSGCGKKQVFAISLCPEPASFTRDGKNNFHRQ